MESVSSDTKLKTMNPLFALNSCSKRNFSPRSDFIKKVTSCSEVLESKLMSEMDICWSSFVLESLFEDETSKVTSFPSNSTGGKVSLPPPWPYKLSNANTSKEENNRIVINDKFFKSNLAKSL